MLVILLQRGRGGGLAGAFGGAGGQSAFGTKAGDVFTWITVTVATIWVLLAGIGGCAMRSAATSFEKTLPTKAAMSSGDDSDSTTDDSQPDIPLNDSSETTPGEPELIKEDASPEKKEEKAPVTPVEPESTEEPETKKPEPEKTETEEPKTEESGADKSATEKPAPEKSDAEKPTAKKPAAGN